MHTNVPLCTIRSCMELTNATKATQLSKTSGVLILHLKQ